MLICILIYLSIHIALSICISIYIYLYHAIVYIMITHSGCNLITVIPEQKALFHRATLAALSKTMILNNLNYSFLLQHCPWRTVLMYI